MGLMAINVHTCDTGRSRIGFSPSYPVDPFEEAVTLSKG